MCPPRVSLIFKKISPKRLDRTAYIHMQTVLCMPELLDGVDGCVTSQQTMKPPTLQCSVL